MKEISTLKKIGITITLFTGCAMCAVAQTSTATVTPVVTYQIAEVTSPSNESDTKAIELYKSYPWFNYKGVANIEEAKKLWVRDNTPAHTKSDATPAIRSNEKSKKNIQ